MTPLERIQFLLECATEELDMAHGRDDVIDVRYWDGQVNALTQVITILSEGETPEHQLEVFR